MSGYVAGYLGDHVGGYLDEIAKLFFQDPVMPSQEPPSDTKSEEVDLPPDDTEDTDGSKLLLLLLLVVLLFCYFYFSSTFSPTTAVQEQHLKCSPSAL